MRTDALLWPSLLFLAAAAAYADHSALNPVVRQETIDQTICVPSYAKGVRPATSYTNGVKQMYFQRVRLDPTLAQYYELDHIIPLALGGHPRNIDNLALQIREGENGANRKDQIEEKLQCLVCSGQVTLADAQHQIASDWQAAYHRYARVKCRRR
jgi:cytochrome c-type biogenesis protein CcmH/NrfF